MQAISDLSGFIILCESVLFCSMPWRISRIFESSYLKDLVYSVLVFKPYVFLNG